MRGLGFLLLLATSFPVFRSSLYISGICQEDFLRGEQYSAYDSACHGEVRYSYYIPDGLTSSDLNDNAAMEISKTPLHKLSSGCQILYRKAVCETIYLPCPTRATDIVSNDFSETAFPFHRPCLSFCSTLFAQCGLDIRQTGSDLNSSTRYDHSQYAIDKPTTTLPQQLNPRNNSTLCNLELSARTTAGPCLSSSVRGNQLSLSTEQLPVQTSEDSNMLSIQSISTASDNTTMAWPVMCPEGFVVPDDPTDPRVIWIPYTGCAMACRLPGFTSESEIGSLNLMVIIGPAIGFPLISFVAITWMTDRIRLRKQYLIFIFICLSAIFTSTFLMVAISGMKDKKFCHDNATEINQMDGITVCTVQAAILVFSFMAFSFCWAIQAVILFCKVVLKRKSKKRIYLHFFIIFILPAGALAYGVFYRSLGYNRVLPFCFISFEPDGGPNNISHDLQFFYIPILISSTVGTACMVAVVIRIFVSFACARNDPKDHAKIAPSESRGSMTFAALIRGSKSAEDRIPEFLNSPSSSTPAVLLTLPSEASCNVFTNPFLFSESQSISEGLRQGPGPGKSEKQQSFKNWSRKRKFKMSALFTTIRKRFKLLRTSLYFLVFYLLLWISIVRYRFDFLVNRDKVAENFQNWVTCVFMNFRGDDSVWKAVCGLKPVGNHSASGSIWIVCVMAGHSILFAYIFFPAIKISYEILYKNCRRKSKNFIRRPFMQKVISYINCCGCLSTGNKAGLGQTDVSARQRVVKTIEVLSVPFKKAGTSKNLTLNTTSNNNNNNINNHDNSNGGVGQGCGLSLSDNTKSYDRNKSRVKNASQTDLTADRLIVSSYVSSIGGMLIRASSLSSRAAAAVSRNNPSVSITSNIGDLDHSFLHQLSHTSENSESILGENSISHPFQGIDVSDSAVNCRGDVTDRIIVVNRGNESVNGDQKVVNESGVKVKNDFKINNIINNSNVSNNIDYDSVHDSINISKSSNNSCSISSYSIVRAYSDIKNDDNNHKDAGNQISNSNSNFLDSPTDIQKTSKNEIPCTFEESKENNNHSKDSTQSCYKNFSSPSSFTTSTCYNQSIRNEDEKTRKIEEKEDSISDEIPSKIIPCRPAEATGTKSPKKLLSEKLLAEKLLIFHLQEMLGGESSKRKDELGSNFDSKSSNVELNDLDNHYSL